MTETCYFNLNNGKWIFNQTNILFIYHLIRLNHFLGCGQFTTVCSYFHWIFLHCSSFTSSFSSNSLHWMTYFFLVKLKRLKKNPNWRRIKRKTENVINEIKLVGLLRRFDEVNSLHFNWITLLLLSKQPESSTIYLHTVHVDHCFIKHMDFDLIHFLIITIHQSNRIVDIISIVHIMEVHRIQ